MQAESSKTEGKKVQFNNIPVFFAAQPVEGKGLLNYPAGKQQVIPCW